MAAMKAFLVWLVLGAILVLGAQAATIDAANCSQSSVQAAINMAAEGDVVRVPAGTCTWTTPVTIASKGITLQGNGVDQTTIVDGLGGGATPPSRDFAEAPLSITGAEGKPFRITGFTFVGAAEGSQGIIFIRGNCKNWRIDNCRFDNILYRGILINGFSYGVIDHCTFVAPEKRTAQAISVIHDGDAAWERPLSLGTDMAVYVEDCIFEYSFPNDGVLDAYNGARYVFRHNAVNGAAIGHHGFDSGGYRSTHSFEIYNNTFTSNTNSVWTFFGSRGGTGVLFGNTVTGLYNRAMVAWYYRTCCCNWCTNVDPKAFGYPCDPYTSCSAPFHTNCSYWGRCDGNNPLDGNSAGGKGYPCKDQPGRTTGQVLAPMYEWNNFLNGADANISVHDPWGCTNPSMADHIQENRDFYNNTQRPGYVAFTYPHPLTQASPGQPAAPSNLRIAQ